MVASRRVGSALLVFVCAATLPVAGQTGANVLVVASTAPESREIATYYASTRGVPPDQILALAIPAGEQIARADYQRLIELPVAAWLTSHAAQDRILYIVLTKGVPLKIAGTPGRNGTTASVDSELTLLYRRMTGRGVAPGGPVQNPYFAADPLKPLEPFSHAKYDVYLVTRLDGFTAADARALVDRSVSAVGSGRVVLDQRLPLGDQANKWLAAAADRLSASGFADRVLLESTNKPAGTADPVIGYSSFGSNDPALNVRRPPLTFAPGAIASMFLSADARTMTEPPATWRPGFVASPYAGSPQALIGDLVRAGVTGVAGQVSEAYLDGAVRPDILYSAYLGGLNLAEAFYRSTPSLGWQTVVLGDPLCAPNRKALLPSAELDPPLDPVTELPGNFSERRLALLAPASASLDARKFALRAEARAVHADIPAAIAALERAVGIDPAFTAAWRNLALLQDQSGEQAKAADAYRKVLALDADDVTALNNVAYSMAVHERRPAEALPLAERAFGLANGSPTVSDTVGWIKHLLGDDQGASPFVESAVRGEPRNADIQLHAAVVYAATGRLEQAAKALQAARALNAAIEQQEDYRAVLRKLGGR